MTHRSDYESKMRYPDKVPNQFSGAKAFVETYGNAVWADLCDSMPTGEVIRVCDAAAALNKLSGYVQPERYLRAVLKAILADYKERPDDYDHQPPFTVLGRTMAKIIL